MGQYGEYLTELLRPLGIYDLTAGGAGESELYALGAVLDMIGDELAAAERETHIATAEDRGLRLRETLFASPPAAETTQQRRAAILALMQIGRDNLTPEAINRMLQGCGIRAVAEENGQGRLLVRFPETVGVPKNFERIRDAILEILPCHLETEFVFRYMNWAECEAQMLTWTKIEAAGHTWESLESTVLSAE